MNALKKLQEIIDEFSKKEIQIAIAESCTGGYVSHKITNIPGASKVFERGVISYSNQAKIDILDINPELINNFGAISEPVAKKMAENIRLISKVDIGIGITGIAGPTGGMKTKPVGLVFIGFSTVERTKVIKFFFKTDRISFKYKVLEEILILLSNYSAKNT